MSVKPDTKYISLPDWMTEPAIRAPAQPSAGKLNFLRKTMKKISQVFENEFFCEKYAARPLFWQNIDTRVKIIISLLFLILSSLVSNPVTLVILASIPLFYAKLSGLPMRIHFRRVWLYIPLVSFFLTLPAATNLFVQGKVMFYLFQPGFQGMKDGLYFTIPGLLASLRIMLRAGISISFCFLLLLTTRWSQITGALMSLRVPVLFVSIMNMTYRYIFVLLLMANNRMEARFLRTVGKLKAADNRSFVGQTTAHLFIRSQDYADEVYDAMCCRGYSREPARTKPPHLQQTDILFIFSSILIILILAAGESVLHV